LKIGDFVKKKEPSLDANVACQSKNFLTRKIIFPHLKDYGKLPVWWLQYLPDSFTHEDAQNLLEKLGCDNTNPYKLLWTGEKRNFIEQDPNTGVYHKTAHYYEVYPKHAA
jgi:hypothetical protein